MVVYMDVIWLLNFIVDVMLLWITAIIMKRPISKWKLLLGGLIGSLLIVMSLTPLSAYAGNPFIKLLFSFVMVFTVFGYKRFKYFISNVLTFYFVTFLTGGILIGVHYFIQFDFQLQSSVLLASVRGFGDPISWLFILFGIPIAWYFSKKRIETFEITTIQFDQLVDVMVEINGVSIQVKGLIDSGNQLYDPLSRQPVMIISTQSFRNQLPTEIIEATEHSENFLQGKTELPSEWSERVRFIPAKTVSKGNQLLLAYKPDQMIIQKDHESWNVQKALISFSNHALSSEDVFQCIVHPKMLTGISIKSVS
ncbi:sigma-E processing peptidase SpoIIGA [Heyndrickxia sp. FSL K6-6286]|uniref:Sporulation sigma-E factor-processing peptidase n=2 Tax=Heyndrickxia oleronia TaxID=38875 RepID=A0A8E2IG11_9BACI|nr:sigma-E processing peptidase SpoIIGA [Heyndrickxia oleronia]NYV67450.1 sigma-E processing peptidase SpoIIGA [Bacillus sp. Gen3]OJH17969.1 sigma-E processing peptidase SpoIIGA [Bacillus obstructivus]MBU5210979.1 sigma-E processing peptidase SpoIIGA [Heyndrickxia oleronia]MCI1589706.1 sigma-E processing peptidase SpoIIGA [Heyndrickxia oleronia]MCI1611547.1 sigma-E processing peptidase SpoIIGA [Heyndrickxia oleronia]